MSRSLSSLKIANSAPPRVLFLATRPEARTDISDNTFGPHALSITQPYQ